MNKSSHENAPAGPERQPADSEQDGPSEHETQRRRPEHQSKVRRRPRRATRKPPDKLIIPQEAEVFHVYPDQAGMRLDQFLKMRLHWRSRTKVQDLIEEREITSRLPGGSPSSVHLDCSYRVMLG